MQKFPLNNIKNKLTHFFVNKKYPLYFVNKKNEEVYFVFFEEKQNIKNFLNKLLATLNIKILDIFYIKNEKSNYIYYVSDYRPDNFLKQKLISFIKSILKIKYHIKISFNMVNLHIATLNSEKFKFVKIERLIYRAFFNEKDLEFPPLHKRIRKKIKRAIKDNCKGAFQLKTEGNIGERRLIAMYKKRD